MVVNESVPSLTQIAINVRQQLVNLVEPSVVVLADEGDGAQRGHFRAHVPHGRNNGDDFSSLPLKNRQAVERHHFINCEVDRIFKPRPIYAHVADGLSRRFKLRHFDAV